MAYIMVTADRPDGAVGQVLHTERIQTHDLESDHSTAQLVERLGWALVDAEEESTARTPEPQLQR
jgi:hypothetical protein